jgi:hypothetical protein
MLNFEEAAVTFHDYTALSWSLVCPQERTAASYPDHPDQGRTRPAVWILSGPRPGYGPESPSPVCPPVERDAKFPPIYPAQWHEVARQREYAAGPDDEAPFTTLTYERRCE